MNLIFYQGKIENYFEIVFNKKVKYKEGNIVKLRYFILYLKLYIIFCNIFEYIKYIDESIVNVNNINENEYIEMKVKELFFKNNILVKNGLIYNIKIKFFF